MVNIEDSLKLSKIASGTLEKQFQHELKKVIDNIRDRNTTDAKRVINIKLTFETNGERKEIFVDSKITSNIVPNYIIKTKIDIFEDEESGDVSAVQTGIMEIYGQQKII